MDGGDCNLNGIRPGGDDRLRGEAELIYSLREERAPANSECDDDV